MHTTGLQILFYVMNKLFGPNKRLHSQPEKKKHAVRKMCTTEVGGQMGVCVPIDNFGIVKA